MFFAYVIISKDASPTIFIEKKRIDSNPQVKEYLEKFEIKDYESILGEIRAASAAGKAIWVSPMSSYAVYDAVSNKVTVF